MNQISNKIDFTKIEDERLGWLLTIILEGGLTNEQKKFIDKKSGYRISQLLKTLELGKN